MTASRGTIGKANHTVSMDGRLAIDQPDIADQRDYFDLLSDWDLPVSFFLAVEPSKKRFSKGADCREMARSKTVVFRQLSDPGHELTVFAKYTGVVPRTVQ